MMGFAWKKNAKKPSVNELRGCVSQSTKMAFHAYCPATGNQPTSMSIDGFSRICFGHQEREAASYCNRVCLGYCLPAGLTFKEIQNYGDEMTTYTDGTCEVCGAKKSIKKCLDKMACSSCDFVYRAVRNKPEMVLELLVASKGRTWVAISIDMPEKQDVELEREEKLHKEKVKELNLQIELLEKRLEDEAEQFEAQVNINNELTRENENLRAAVIAAGEYPEVKFSPKNGGIAATGRDSAVLDLALDVIAGKVHGLDVERLQALR